MLGEGFDLPALKIAAVHDPQKSLGVTLQFIGRFARTSTAGSLGEASMFVARTEIEVDKRLRELYAEDSDWNLILRNLTEVAVEDQQAVSDFEEGFTSVPDEVTLRSLLPKMSTVVYRAPSTDWEPQNIVDFFGEENLLTSPIGLNAEAGVAWCVVEYRNDVRWGDLRTIEEVSYQLYVLYFDREHKLLYINNSANDGVFEDLAEAVLGIGAERYTGSTVYRVMADIERLVPTNVGVLDAHDQFRRFSMHVGPDVTASFTQAEAGTKSQTNISGGGYRDGEHVTISASLKGRIWSHATASSLKHWCDWCDASKLGLQPSTLIHFPRSHDERPTDETPPDRPVPPILRVIHDSFKAVESDRIHTTRLLANPKLTGMSAKRLGMLLAACGVQPQGQPFVENGERGRGYHYSDIATAIQSISAGRVRPPDYAYEWSLPHGDEGARSDRTRACDPCVHGTETRSVRQRARNRSGPDLAGHRRYARITDYGSRAMDAPPEGGYCTDLIYLTRVSIRVEINDGRAVHRERHKWKRARPQPRGAAPSSGHRGHHYSCESARAREVDRVRARSSGPVSLPGPPRRQLLPSADRGSSPAVRNRAAA